MWYTLSLCIQIIFFCSVITNLFPFWFLKGLSLYVYLVALANNVQTRSFYQYLIDMYFEVHNFESITRIVKASWIHTWKTYLWQLQVLGQQVPKDFDVSKLFALSSRTVKNCIIYWWHSEGYNKLKEQLKTLRQTTGKILRCDHTYKVVSGLGVHHDTKWVTIF
jgi:hypothetical protein